MRFYFLLFTLIPFLAIGQTSDKDLNALKIKTELLTLKGQLDGYIEKCNNKSIETIDLDDLLSRMDKVQRRIERINEDIQDMALAMEDKMGDDEENKSADRNYRSDFEEDEGEEDSKISKFWNKKESTKINDWDFVIGWGINSVESDILDSEVWGSNNWEFGPVYKRYFNTSRKAAFILGITYNSYSIKLNDQEIRSSDEFPGFTVFNDNNLDRSKFRMGYVNVPLGFTIKTSKKTELFLGGHVGLRTHARMFTEYDNDRNEDIKQEAVANFGTSRWQYGGSVSWGWDESFRIFGKYNASSIFEDADANILTIGIRSAY